MGKDRVYLETTTGILGFVGMWDNDMGLWNTVKGYLVLILISMSTEAIFAYLIWQIYGKRKSKMIRCYYYYDSLIYGFR